MDGGGSGMLRVTGGTRGLTRSGGGISGGGMGGTGGGGGGRKLKWSTGPRPRSSIARQIPHARSQLSEVRDLSRRCQGLQPRLTSMSSPSPGTCPLDRSELHADLPRTRRSLIRCSRRPAYARGDVPTSSPAAARLSSAAAPEALRVSRMTRASAVCVCTPCWSHAGSRISTASRLPRPTAATVPSSRGGSVGGDTACKVYRGLGLENS